MCLRISQCNEHRWISLRKLLKLRDKVLKWLRVQILIISVEALFRVSSVTEVSVI